VRTSAESFAYICRLLARRAAIVIEPGKEYLVDSRLLPIAKREGYASIDGLVARLRVDEQGALGREVVEAMTTNETSFFRDGLPFGALERTILPELMRARRSTRTLRIWCAAASTGQEPYSLAILIREHLPSLLDWDLEILATDINSAVLAAARRGVYRQLDVSRGMPPALLTKYFDRRANEWELRSSVRRMVSFQQLNLSDAWPSSSFDLVLMRNVLIYFGLEAKRDILRRVRRVLRADGYLLLGGAETTVNVDDQLAPIRAEGAVVFQQRRDGSKREG